MAELACPIPTAAWGLDQKDVAGEHFGTVGPFQHLDLTILADDAVLAQGTFAATAETIRRHAAMAGENAGRHRF